MPAREPPHKPDGPRLPTALRARLVAAATAGEPGLGMSSIEIEREGPSYTADTLEAVAAAAPGARLWFIMGADQLAQLRAWRDPERIVRAARLAIAPRAGVDRHQVERLGSEVAPDRIDWLRIPLIGISSSMIRERLAAGWPVRWLVPPAVETVLREEGLVAS